MAATNDVDETLSISIRFLGPVDTDNEDLNEGVIPIEPNSSAEDAWDRAISEGTIPEGAEITDGRRTALPCDDDDDVDDYLDADATPLFESPALDAFSFENDGAGDCRPSPC